MTNHVPTIVEILINWFPMLLLIAVWAIFMISFVRRSKGRSGLTAVQICEQQLQEQKRHNEALEKILARLEQRFPQ